MKRITLLLRAQKCWRIGRTFSSVSGFAFDGSSAGATQMFSTPSRGAIQETHLPSGLTRPWVLVGLPKKVARGISSTPLVCAKETAAHAAESIANSRLRSFMVSPLERCDAHDLDLVGRVGELRLDGGPRRGLPGRHPLLPHGIHRREVLHVGQEDLRRQQFGLVAAYLLQEL